MPIQIRTYSGDLYEVPDGRHHEIVDYRNAVDVIKMNRRSPLSHAVYKTALDIMKKYETGDTGWHFLDSK